LILGERCGGLGEGVVKLEMSRVMGDKCGVEGDRTFVAGESKGGFVDGEVELVKRRLIGERSGVGGDGGVSWR